MVSGHSRKKIFKTALMLSYALGLSRTEGKDVLLQDFV